jgi:hypothetical protein
MTHGPPSKGLPNHDVAFDRAGITVFRDLTFLAAGPASERGARRCRDTTRRNRSEQKKRRPRREVSMEVGAPASGMELRLARMP